MTKRWTCMTLIICLVGNQNFTNYKKCSLKWKVHYELWGKLHQINVPPFYSETNFGVLN
jgi:hypothetical protein